MFSIKSFCLTVPKVSVGESFTVALVSCSEKVWRMRGGGSYQNFPSKNLCLRVPNNSVGESFSVALISVTERVWIRRRGEIKIFRRKFFVSPCWKNSVGESFTVALKSCSEKVYGQEGKGVSRYSVEIFLCHSAEKFRRGNLYCCIKVVYRKSLDKGGGVSRFSVRNFLSHSAETLGRGIPYCYSNFGYRK